MQVGELDQEPTTFEIMKRTKANKAGESANEKAKTIAVNTFQF